VIGTTIGNFEITRQLGKGGMGVVWLAHHKSIRTKVAIKTLAAEVSADTTQVERLFNEAVAVSKIKHAGITKIFDVGFLPTGEAYLVMEYLEGESLAARIARSGRLGVVALADVCRQIASVLEATHAQRITHRDLKPDNIYLVADAELARGERVKVLDFGIAKLSSDTGVTGSGALGTPLYMSPEQWKTPSAVDGRADIYSLGCIAFELACGRPPFVAGSVGEACTKHLNDPAPSLRSRIAAIPEPLDTLVARMLAKPPGERPSLAEIRNVLAELEASTAARASSEGALASTLPDDPAASATEARSAVTLATGPGGGDAAAANPVPAVVVARQVIATTLGSAAATVDKPVAQPARTWLAIGAGVLIVIAGVVTWNLRAGAHDGTQQEPVPAQTAASLPAAATTIRVQIATVPANAEVRIDGAIVPNPYDGKFTPQDVQRNVTVTAPGFKNVSQMITFDDDRNLRYELVPDRVAGSAARPSDSLPAGHPAVVPASQGPTFYRGTKGSLLTTEPGAK
jgi:hypothetical protein